MQVVMMPVGSIFPYPNNPRRNDAAVPKVARSLQEFGWRQPIVVDEQHVVIVGHTRLRAAQMLGMQEVPVHVATGLSAKQIAAYRLADNRTGEDAEWDDAKLSAEMLAINDGSVFDLTLTGFSDEEIEAALAGTSEILPGAKLDEAPPLGKEKDARTQHGDVIALGRHRLICGDSTDAKAWEALLGGALVDAVITDPPYGVDYVGKTKDRLTVANDHLKETELTDFLRAALSLAIAHSRPGASWYVYAPAGPAFHSFATVALELGWWRQTLVWVKDVFVLGRSDYHYRHEACLYGWAPGGSHAFYGGRTQDTVLECARPKVSKEHPTMKPVALIERSIRNSTQPADRIVDCFGGSGTTLLAAEMTGRTAFLIERSRAYCDVICQRWETVTGSPVARE